MTRLSFVLSTALVLCALILPHRAAAAQPVTLVLDASQAARGIAYAHERIPVSPGPLTLVYPKWIPGEHGPTGPLADMAALRMSAGGRDLEWHRDLVDTYAFHVDVPPGVDAIDVDFDVLLNAAGDTMSTHALALINWNRALLYKEGVNSHDYSLRPSIVLPPEWDYATALRDGVRNGDRVDFAVTSLEMLVDSPLDMGRFSKRWDLWKEGNAFVQFDAFADGPENLDIPPELLKAYERVPAEAFALYGSRHFVDYHALLTLSDEVGTEGIEHHQSSDNRAPDDFLTESDQSLTNGDLVTHEFSHSWNGKYRRPDDLTTQNFQVPQKTDLLWVYEGMNQYLGDVLSFRAGIRKPSEYPEYLAVDYANHDFETGRYTTPLIDTTAGAPYYYGARGSYRDIRRTSGDFYDEGELVWLDADTIIRERSAGKRSLDTFLHKFTEPSTTGPMVVTYTRSQVEELLNGVEAYDWHAFFDKYVYHIDVHPPTDELARTGWKLVYTDKPNAFITAGEKTGKNINRWFDLGMQLNARGEVTDVRVNSPAWKAGAAIGMQLLAVNNRAFSKDVLKAAIERAQHAATPISLIVEQTDWFQTLTINYTEGMKYPHLVRIEGTPDMLAEIMAPHAVSR
jgi:predicted metalloprotease with PDZ domain